MKLRDYEILYDLPAGEYSEKEVGGIRTRTIRAGDTLEVECYPITRITFEARQEVQRRRSSPAQQQLNQRNRQRRIARLIDENFTQEDYVLTGTYEYPAEDFGMANPDDLRRLYDRMKLPWELDRARRDVLNYIQRVRRAVKRTGGDPKAVRHLYVLEEGKDRGDGLPPRYHFHLVLHAPGLSADQVKALWPFGFTSCDRLDLEHNGGAERLSKYLAKQRRYRRCWGHSRNLREPTVTVSDRRVSRRRAALVAQDIRQYGRQIMEALYPGYRCEELPEVKYSDFVAGAYIRARLRRSTPQRGAMSAPKGPMPQARGEAQDAAEARACAKAQRRGAKGGES